jgi:hypothetical protein
VIVTVTFTGADTYDLEIQTAADKKLTKLPVGNCRVAGDHEFGGFQSG